MIFTFEARPSREEEDSEKMYIPNSVQVITPDIVVITHVLERFEDFMRGCGFSFKEFVSLREGQKIVEDSDSEYESADPEFFYLASFSEIQVGTRFKSYSNDIGVLLKLSDTEFSDTSDPDLRFTVSSPDNYNVYISRSDAQDLTELPRDF